MWPFKKKQQQEESPEEIAALARLDEATDEAWAAEFDKPLAVPGNLGARGSVAGGLAGGLAAAGAFDRERLLEKAEEADEDAKS